VSWFSDYQAAARQCRYRGPSGKGTELCHTLNGSALAWSRIGRHRETHRQPDGPCSSQRCYTRTSQRDHDHRGKRWQTVLVVRRSPARQARRLVSVVGLLITVVLGLGITKLDFRDRPRTATSTRATRSTRTISLIRSLRGQAMATVISMNQGHHLPTKLFTSSTRSQFTTLHDALTTRASIRASSRR